jgi:hypothetical protein
VQFYAKNHKGFQKKFASTTDMLEDGYAWGVMQLLRAAYHKALAQRSHAASTPGSPEHRQQIKRSRQAASLKEAIDTFAMGEYTTGLRILGSPLGSKTIQKTYTGNFTTTLVNDTQSMCTTLPDPQTVTQIYRECLVARVPFQLTADIITNVNPKSLPLNNRDWKSPLTEAVRQTTIDIIGFATGLDKIPEYALEMASIPESLHGLGITCPERIAVLSFLLALFQTTNTPPSACLYNTQRYNWENTSKTYMEAGNARRTRFLSSCSTMPNQLLTPCSSPQNLVA